MTHDSPTNRSIRPATPDQAGLLSDLAFRSKAYWGYSTEFMTTCRDELTYTAKQLSSSRYAFFVCVVDGAVVGFHGLDFDDSDSAELEALFVAPEHIGNGIGRTLLEHASEHARMRGATQVVIQGDPNAEQFYLAGGATRTGNRESSSVPGRQLPLFCIELRGDWCRV